MTSFTEQDLEEKALRLYRARRELEAANDRIRSALSPLTDNSSPLQVSGLVARSLRRLDEEDEARVISVAPYTTAVSNAQALIAAVQAREVLRSEISGLKTDLASGASS